MRKIFSQKNKRLEVGNNRGCSDTTMNIVEAVAKKSNGLVGKDDLLVLIDKMGMKLSSSTTLAFIKMIGTFNPAAIASAIHIYLYGKKIEHLTIGAKKKQFMRFLVSENDMFKDLEPKKEIKPKNETTPDNDLNKLDWSKL